jgi:hypothetical protein
MRVTDQARGFLARNHYRHDTKLKKDQQGSHHQYESPEQSKTLKVGDRVCFNDDPADRGKVTSIEARYVAIKWEDGHQSFLGP